MSVTLDMFPEPTADPVPRVPRRSRPMAPYVPDPRRRRPIALAHATAEERVKAHG
jgi:hypothetical protein